MHAHASFREEGSNTNAQPIRRRKERGQSLVEFAIASTVLFMILLGLIDFGRVYFFNVTMHGAAREGARHGAWFDPGSNTNIYLDDSDILTSVNHSLSPASLDATFPGGSATTCPSSTDGNPYNNPPFPDSAYPTTLNSPYLYICYKHQSDAGYFAPMSTHPTDQSFEQGDVETILLMDYGLVTGFLQPIIGQGLQVAAYAHFTIQGSQP